MLIAFAFLILLRRSNGLLHQTPSGLHGTASDLNPVSDYSNVAAASARRGAKRHVSGRSADLTGARRSRDFSVRVRRKNILFFNFSLFVSDRPIQ
jgi:hypothetical protein